jgi:hypothetical protein
MWHKINDVIGQMCGRGGMSRHTVGRGAEETRIVGCIYPNITSGLKATAERGFVSADLSVIVHAQDDPVHLGTPRRFNRAELVCMRV